jgi:pSer/pThr/pTyr-binding forkhead associated (FHA) protein
MNQKVIKFTASQKISLQAQELCRIKLVKAGADTGATYIINQMPITIGRDANNDIVILDPTVSRQHLMISYVNQCFVAQPFNQGIQVAVNGVPTRGSVIKNLDKIGIGNCVLEFQVPSLQNQQTGTSILLGLFSKKSNNESQTKGINQVVTKNKKPLMIILGLLILSFLLPEAEKRKNLKKAYVDPNEVVSERSLSAIPQPVTDEKAYKEAEKFFQEGFREYREKNYSRAKMKFETALQIYPIHAMSLVYIENVRLAMEEETKKLFEAAKKDEEALRYEAAKSKYEAVIRLYLREPNHENYKEAKLKIEELEKKLKEGK